MIIVSARGLERDKVAALDLGADDHIVKPFGTAELLARIRTALRHSPKYMGSEPQGRMSKTIGELCIDYQNRLVTLREDALHLTTNEHKLLALLSINAGKVLREGLAKQNGHRFGGRFCLLFSRVQTCEIALFAASAAVHCCGAKCEGGLFPHDSRFIRKQRYEIGACHVGEQHLSRKTLR